MLVNVTTLFPSSLPPCSKSNVAVGASLTGITVIIVESDAVSPWSSVTVSIIFNWPYALVSGFKVTIVPLMSLPILKEPLNVILMWLASRARSSFITLLASKVIGWSSSILISTGRFTTGFWFSKVFSTSTILPSPSTGYWLANTTPPRFSVI